METTGTAVGMRVAVTVALPVWGLGPEDLTCVGIGPASQAVARVGLMPETRGHYDAVGVFDAVTGEALHVRAWLAGNVCDRAQDWGDLARFQRQLARSARRPFPYRYHILTAALYQARADRTKETKA